ncbi:MAG: DUF1816 domain-containing protein [Waterburya sp.]
MNYRKLFSIIGLPYKSANRTQPEFPWWVKIVTVKPECIYYFGPFDSQLEAIESQSGYLEDLTAEKAKGISIEIKQARPKLLTISD